MDLQDFMEQFEHAAPPTEKTYPLEHEYIERFGHALPLEMLPPGLDDETLKAAIEKCLESGSDDLLSLLGIKADYTKTY